MIFKKSSIKCTTYKTLAAIIFMCTLWVYLFCMATEDNENDFKIRCDFVRDTRRYTCESSSLNLTVISTRSAIFEGIHEPGFSDNDVTDISIVDSNIAILPYEMARTFANVRTLSVTHSHLKLINRKIFAGMSELRTLRLEHNEISLLPWNVFSELAKLERLLLSDNSVTHLPSRLLVHQTQLKWLGLDDNFLGRLSAKHFRNNTQLEVMSFKGNILSEIGVDFERLPRLILLDLRHNDCVNSVYKKIELGARSFYATIKEEMAVCGRRAEVTEASTLKVEERTEGAANKEI